jgi:probable F420-dependent oxidoreductase
MSMATDQTGASGLVLQSGTGIHGVDLVCQPLARRQRDLLDPAKAACEVERIPQLAVNLPSYSAVDPGGWQHLLDLARAADAAGIDRLLASDHVVFGEHLEAYARPEVGGIEGGKQPTGPDGLWLEPLTVLSVVSGITVRIRLMTCILQAALRRPVVLAKTAATLDVLSQGRLDLGVGVGWQREEYDAAGLEFAKRGQDLDHTLTVCRTLWRDSPAQFESQGLQFNSIHCMPQPHQPGGIPIWVSGTVNQRVLSRIARFGIGWIPWGPYVADPSSGVRQIREALSAANRDPSELRVLGSLRVEKFASGVPDLTRTMDAIPGLLKAGITDFRIALPIPEGFSAATDYLSEAVAAFREATGKSEQ